MGDQQVEEGWELRTKRREGRFGICAATQRLDGSADVGNELFELFVLVMTAVRNAREHSADGGEEDFLFVLRMLREGRKEAVDVAQEKRNTRGRGEVDSLKGALEVRGREAPVRWDPRVSSASGRAACERRPGMRPSTHQDSCMSLLKDRGPHFWRGLKSEPSAAHNRVAPKHTAIE